MPDRFSIIFMHDDGRNYRWRMSMTLARVLLAALILLPLVVGISLWFNWYLFQERQHMQSEVRAKQLELERQEQTAVRLASLEQYLQQYDPQNLGKLNVIPAPEANVGISMAPIAEMPPEAAVETPPVSDAELGESPESSTPPQEDSEPAPVAPEAPEQTAASPSDENEQTAVSAPEEPTPDSVATSGSDVAETPVSEPAVSAPASGIIDESPVDKEFARVENISARQVGSRSLRIAFDLYNGEKVQQLAGNVTFDLIMPDGSFYELGSQGDTTYRINRLKRIIGNPVLPGDVQDTTGARIRVNIYAEDELIYREIVPLEQLE